MHTINFIDGTNVQHIKHTMLTYPGTDKLSLTALRLTFLKFTVSRAIGNTAKQWLSDNTNSQKKNENVHLEQPYKRAHFHCQFLTPNPPQTNKTRLLFIFQYYHKSSAAFTQRRTNMSFTFKNGLFLCEHACGNLNFTG